MSAFLKECLKLADVDPGGWTVIRVPQRGIDYPHIITQVTYGNDICFRFIYSDPWAGPKYLNYILVDTPVSQKLSWWECRQLKRLIDKLVMSKLKSVSVKAAERVLEERYVELDQIAEKLDQQIGGI
jgi:hypothetical protein